jgi:hypothetical protein
MIMRRNNQFIIVLVGVGLALTASCSTQSSPTAGGGTRGGNPATITAIAIQSGGSPAANAAVRLRRSDYVTQPSSIAKSVAIIGADAMTDDRGRFEIIGIDPGSYRIEVNNGQSAFMVACTLTADEKRNFGRDTLRAYATMAGSLDTAGQTGGHLYAQVEGLDRLVLVESNGNFTISTLPAGTHTVRVVDAGQTEPVAVASGISVAPGEIGQINLIPGWRFSKRLYINTTPTGAGVVENVTNFPLLVRLDSTTAHFDFAQCAIDGVDLRFGKSDGTPLSYEIEQWDPAHKQAAIWVKVDTIYGNTDRQFIVMYWGALAAPATFSNGEAVFDAGNGFAGVWHFASSNPTLDATANHNTAIDSGTSSSPSLLGAARSFDSSSFMYVPDTASLEPPSITISSWISIETIPLKYTLAKIVHKGNSGDGPKYGSYALELHDDTAGLENLPGFQISNLDSTYHYGQARNAVVVHTWMYLTGTFDAATGQGAFYLDGNLQQTFSTASPMDYYVDKPYPVTFGCQLKGGNLAYGHNANFQGQIDEVRISSIPRSAAWIRLEYESQKPEARVVELR